MPGACAILTHMVFKLSHNAWVVIGGGVILAVILGLALWQGGAFLGARVENGRLILAQGEEYTVGYVTSSSVPSVKIDLCLIYNQEDCTTLAAKATGSEFKVKVPTDYAVGDSFFKVSERNSSGQLTGVIQRRIPVLVTEVTKIKPSSSSGTGVFAPVPTAKQSPYIPSVSVAPVTNDASFLATLLKLLFPSSNPSTPGVSPTPTYSPAATPPILDYAIEAAECISNRTNQYEVQVLWKPATATLIYKTKDQAAWSTIPDSALSPTGQGYSARIFSTQDGLQGSLQAMEEFQLQLVPKELQWRDKVGSEVYLYSSGPLIQIGQEAPPGSKPAPNSTLYQSYSIECPLLG